MEPPTSPKLAAEITLTPLPEQQQHKERAESPVSKRRKVEHKVVITVKVEENSGKHKNEGPPSDFWSWRKYGQKPIKGSPYPRGYYRCSTSKGCSAKKQVERCRTDASLLIITYTSSHNHAGPDIQHISSSSTGTEQKTLEEIEKEEVPPAIPDSLHNSTHHGDPNSHQSTSRSATASEQQLPENGNAEVASHPDSNGDCTAAKPDLHQVSCFVTEAEHKPADTEASPENPDPIDDDDDGSDLMSCSTAPADDKLLTVNCGSVEDARPNITSVSSSAEAEAKASETNNLDIEKLICPILISVASPVCEAVHHNCNDAAMEDPTMHLKCEEAAEEDHIIHIKCKEAAKEDHIIQIKCEEAAEEPPTPIKNSPEGNVAMEKTTPAETNHTLHPEEAAFDDGSAAMSCAQAGLSPEEFDFYDELEELPSIPPWTSILMGSFFDERIPLPS